MFLRSTELRLPERWLPVRWEQLKVERRDCWLGVLAIDRGRETENEREDAGDINMADDAASEDL